MSLFAVRTLMFVTLIAWFVTVALAHQSTLIDERYRVTVGFVNNPAYAGMLNHLDLMIRTVESEPQFVEGLAESRSPRTARSGCGSPSAPCAIAPVPTRRISSLPSRATTAFAFGATWAHAGLVASSIPNFGVLSSSDALVLEFSMELEVALSRFELVPVPLSAERVPENPIAPSEAQRMLLNALAARAVAARLSAGSNAAEAHLQLIRDPARGRTERLTLIPQGPLPVGLYALSMAVLAVDGHTTREHVLFWVLDAP